MMIAKSAVARLFAIIALSATAAAEVSAQITTGSCSSPTSEAFLDVANVRARILTAGNQFYRGNPSVYEVPKDGGMNSIFTSVMWLGGKVDGEVRVSAARYGDYQLWTGPIHDGLQPPPDCSSFDKIWNLYRFQVEQYEDQGTPFADLASWPTGLGAPTRSPVHEDDSAVNADGVDNDNDGEIDESDETRLVFDDIKDQPLSQRLDRVINLEIGERPDMIGDQMLWWINNDIGNQHAFGSETSEPIGLEIHNTAFAFDQPGDLGAATFYRVKLFYKGSEPLTDAYIGLFSDFDIGNYDDDYVGSDTTLGLGYGYNGDNLDEGGSGYGSTPPAIGYDFLQGPIVPSAGDTALVSGIKVGDHRNLNMTSVLYFTNGGAQPNTDPMLPDEFYNSLRGVWKDGSSVLAGGDGLNASTTITTRFVYPADPVSGDGWSELNIDGNGTANAPGDRRMVVSAGPFDMEPSSTQDVVYGIVWARGDDHLSSVTKLKSADIEIQSFADANFEFGDPCAADFNITSQEQLDYFPSECLNVSGSIVISGTDITNLQPVFDLRSIGGALRIEGNQNLSSLNGLPASFVVDGALSIGENPLLENLDGLVGLEAIGGDLSISDNAVLAGCSYGLFKVTSTGGPGGSTSMSQNAAEGDCNGDGADLVAESKALELPDRIHVSIAADSDLLLPLTITNSREFELYWEVTSAPPSTIENFLVTQNANGPLDPPEYGAFSVDNNGFPHPTTADRPSPRQQSTGAMWGIHSEAAVDYASFLSQIRWERNRRVVGSYDYEIRFTAEGSEAFRLYEDSSFVSVPFELWRIGNAADSDESDDVRLIAVTLERSNDNNPGAFDIGGDHTVSSNNDDPYTDRFYWREPIDQSPGESGYNDFLADQSMIGAEIFARMVLVNWDGGTQAPWVEMPEVGTVFQIITKKQPFLGPDTRRLTIPPFSKRITELTFESHGLSAGRYTTDFIVETNDPEVPTKTIEVIVDVASFESTQAVDSTVALEYVFANASDTVSAVMFVTTGTVSSLTLSEIGAAVEPSLEPSLLRYFDLDANGGSGFDATVRFWYHDEDIPDDVEENELTVFHLTDDGWTMLGGTVDPDLNTIAVSGLTEFGRFAIADPNAVNNESSVQSSLPEAVLLSPIYPNPAGELITIRFQMHEAMDATIELYDGLGRRVAEVSKAMRQAGEHVVQHPVGSLSAGVYFVRLQVGEVVLSKPVVMVR